MGSPATRSYDVWLQCYEDQGLQAFKQDPVRLLDARGTMKWPGMARLLAAKGEDVRKYDAVWFPDDDVSIDPPRVERLFETFHALDMWLAQPSLGDGSYFSSTVTLHCKTFTVRYTNFVEVMAPLFSREALFRCATIFEESVSGWGLDRIWPHLLGNPRDKIGIVDAVSMLHTLPVGVAGWYSGLQERPLDEAARLCVRHGVPLPFTFRHYGGIPVEAGLDRSTSIPAGVAFLFRLSRGVPRSQRLKGRFWRRQWRSVRTGMAGRGVRR